MMSYRTMARVAGLVAGTALMIPGALPVSAAGDTGRYAGCAAHWRERATWNECIRDSKQPIRVQLNVRCNNQGDWEGAYKRVEGAVDPLDRFECRHGAQEAYNEFRQP